MSVKGPIQCHSKGDQYSITVKGTMMSGIHPTQGDLYISKRHPTQECLISGTHPTQGNYMSERHPTQALVDTRMDNSIIS